MSEEHIKDIVIALINNNLFYAGADNEETAKEVAKFVNTVKLNLIKKTSKLRLALDETEEEAFYDEIGYVDDSDDTTIY